MDPLVLDEDVVVEAVVAVGAPTSIVVGVPLTVVSTNAAVGVVDTPEVVALSNTTGFAFSNCPKATNATRHEEYQTILCLDLANLRQIFRRIGAAN